MNASTTFLNSGNSILFTEGISCVIVSIPHITITVDNHYTHIPHGKYSVKDIHIWIHYLEVNCSRGRNPERDMTNHMFTPSLNNNNNRKKI